jgi:hypothetical protein
MPLVKIIRQIFSTIAQAWQSSTSRMYIKSASLSLLSLVIIGAMNGHTKM